MLCVASLTIFTRLMWDTESVEPFIIPRGTSVEPLSAWAFSPDVQRIPGTVSTMDLHLDAELPRSFHVYARVTSGAPAVYGSISTCVRHCRTGTPVFM
jgi:hypothetical protein